MPRRHTEPADQTLTTPSDPKGQQGTKPVTSGVTLAVTNPQPTTFGLR
jgi:hypothetical protein